MKEYDTNRSLDPATWNQGHEAYSRGIKNLFPKYLFSMDNFCKGTKPPLQ